MLRFPGSQLSLASFEHNEKMLLTPRNVSDPTHVLTPPNEQGDATLQKPLFVLQEASASQQSASQPEEFHLLQVDLSQPDVPSEGLAQAEVPPRQLDDSDSSAASKDDVIDSAQKQSGSNDDYVYSSDFCSEPITSAHDEEALSPVERAYLAQLGASGTQDTHASSDMLEMAADDPSASDLSAGGSSDEDAEQTTEQQAGGSHNSLYMYMISITQSSLSL